MHATMHVGKHHRHVFLRSCFRNIACNQEPATGIYVCPSVDHFDLDFIPSSRLMLENAHFLSFPPTQLTEILNPYFWKNFCSKPRGMPLELL